MNAIQQQIQCPNCGSNNILIQRKGFDVGKAIIGDIIAGPLGLLAGNIGSNEIVLTCLTCGNVFYPSAALNNNEPELNPEPVIEEPKVLTEAEITRAEQDEKIKQISERVAYFVIILSIIAMTVYIFFKKFYQV